MQDRLFSEAAAEFEQALAVDPNNDEVRIRYATCLFAQQRDGEARKQFEIERQRLGDRPGLNYYLGRLDLRDRKSTRLNSSHLGISYAVFCLKTKNQRLNFKHLGFAQHDSSVRRVADPDR